MTKNEALKLLGDGTPTAAARAMGITVSAVFQWPQELNREHEMRVHAALWRRLQALDRIKADQGVAQPAEQA